MVLCVASSVLGVKERRNIDGMRSRACDNLLAEKSECTFPQGAKRSLRNKPPTTFLVRFLAVVCLEIVECDINDVVVCVRHAADSEFPYAKTKNDL